MSTHAKQAAASADTTTPGAETTKNELPGRRGFVAASATLGTLAAAASLWATRKPEQQAAQAQQPAEQAQSGYQLTEHVKRYYQTTTL